MTAELIVAISELSEDYKVAFVKLMSNDFEQLSHLVVENLRSELLGLSVRVDAKLNQYNAYIARELLA